MSGLTVIDHQLLFPTLQTNASGLYPHHGRLGLPWSFAAIDLVHNNPSTSSQQHTKGSAEAYSITACFAAKNPRNTC